MEEKEKLLSELKSSFGEMPPQEIERLASDISEGRISYSKESTTGKMNLVFKAGSQVPPTVIKGSLTVNLSPKQHDEKTEASQQTLEPFSTIEGRDWMAERLLAPEEINFHPPLILLGNGPFEAEELAGFLHRNQIAAYLENKYPAERSPEGDEWGVFGSIHQPLIVLGREKFQTRGFLSLLLRSGLRDRATNFPVTFDYWIQRIGESEERCCYLRSRSLENLTFISQEMLLAEIFTKGNGTRDFGDPWIKHIEEHPGLKAVHGLREEEALEAIDDCFEWPSTVAEPGNGSFDQEDWPKVGMLKILGYSVGENGEMKSTRQKILSEVFEMVNLPHVKDQNHVDSWGGAKTGARLKKMAQSIAAFCRSARRRDEYGMSLAIEEWEEDLAWLKTTYYEGKFDRQFQWPETTDR